MTVLDKRSIYGVAVKNPPLLLDPYLFQGILGNHLRRDGAHRAWCARASKARFSNSDCGSAPKCDRLKGFLININRIHLAVY